MEAQTQDISRIVIGLNAAVIVACINNQYQSPANQLRMLATSWLCWNSVVHSPMQPSSRY